MGQRPKKSLCPPPPTPVPKKRLVQEPLVPRSNIAGSWARGGGGPKIGLKFLPPSVNHLEERFLDKAQVRASYTSPLWGRLRRIPQDGIRRLTRCKIIILRQKMIPQ